VTTSAAPTRTLRGTGAHLSPEELLAFTRFFDSARLIEEAIAKHLSERHGMNISDYEVLVRLDGAGDEMRLTELADLCISSKSKLTHTLVRLEDRGWIRREKAVGDGRGVVAHLELAGADALAAAAPGHAEIIKHHLIDCWPSDQLESIGQAMAASAARLRELRL